jgi:hypothetical protein
MTIRARPPYPLPASPVQASFATNHEVNYWIFVTRSIMLQYIHADVALIRYVF